MAIKKPKASASIGSVAHYEDGRYYDQAYRRRRHDVRFYADLAKRCGGPVLELGCGTGRVTFAIAREGIDVVGVESMEPMLVRASERLSRLPKRTREHVELRLGDLERTRLRRRFPLVVAPFNVWMHLYTRDQVERGFATARHHLTVGGEFVFDVLLPDPACLARDPSRPYRGGRVPHPRDGETYRYSEYFRYDPSSQIETTILDFEHPTVKRKSFCTPLTQRQFFPAELAALLHYNGFSVESHTGDFTGTPITSATESQVVVAKVRRAYSRKRTSQ